MEIAIFQNLKNSQSRIAPIQKSLDVAAALPRPHPSVVHFILKNLVIGLGTAIGLVTVHALSCKDISTHVTEYLATTTRVINR